LSLHVEPLNSYADLNITSFPNVRVDTNALKLIAVKTKTFTVLTPHETVIIPKVATVWYEFFSAVSFHSSAIIVFCEN